MVEHCISHHGGSVGSFLPHRKCPRGAPEVSKNVIFLPEIARYSYFWARLGGPNEPPRCEIQCSTMFNQCSTHLGLLGPPMANYGIFRQKMAIFGHKNGQNHWNLMGARLNIIQSNPRDKMDAMVFAKSNIFLTPPPFSALCPMLCWICPSCTCFFGIWKMR